MTETENMGENIAQTVHEITDRLSEVEIVEAAGDTGDGAYFLSVPKGRELKELEPYFEKLRETPRRLQGTARLHDADSLIAHVNRFKDDGSALFLEARNPGSMTLTAVYDYAQGFGSPRWGGHRALYEFPLAEEFAAWQGSNKKSMDQAEFAEFIDDRILDIVAPPPAEDGPEGEHYEPIERYAQSIGGSFAGPQRMMELSRGLSVKAEHHVEAHVKLESGEGAIRFAETHKAGDGGEVKVPPLFQIAVPLFEKGAVYRLAARLRYRVKGPAVVWVYELFRLRETVDHAVGELAGHVAAETGLPLLRGVPE